MEGNPATPTLTNLLYAGIATVLALFGKGVVRTVQRWISEQMPEAAARARKTDAEAQQIEVKAGIDAATAINQIIAQMLQTQQRLDEMRAESTIRDAELEVYEVQNKSLKALLDLHGIVYETIVTKDEIVPKKE